jgi:hypothetical protein
MKDFREEAREKFKRLLLNFQPSIIAVWCSGEDTPSGRVDRYRILGITEDAGVLELTKFVADSFGYRMNSFGQLLVSGVGYNKVDEIAQQITDMFGGVVRRVKIDRV